jgi:AraC family transcriptional regulator of adaptative response/methylated-DNA-[protein]-cysteine methyltransferase
VLVGKEEGKLVAALRGRFKKAEVVRDQAACAREVGAVARFVDSPREEVGVELDIRGTVFQKKVWEEVRKIPVGEVRTYSEIAERVGAGKGVRAVGTACTRVPLVVVIPCHRVVRKGGGTGSGFSGGSERQRAMLAREGVGR